eukprot:snap_masked-scaffold_86-processed-gene-0.8-mRNA-1 protein AED:1.00 eAED:1.00 QI:0/0/0/0/1/1/2/0/426
MNWVDLMSNLKMCLPEEHWCMFENCTMIVVFLGLLVFPLFTLRMVEVQMDIDFYQNSSFEGCKTTIAKADIRGIKLRNNCNFLEQTFPTLDHYIRPARHNMVSLALFYESKLNVREKLSEYVNATLEVEFESCNQYISEQKAALDVYFTEVLQNLKEEDLVRHYPTGFSNVNNTEILLSDQCVNYTTFPEPCVETFSFAVLNSSLLVRGEIDSLLDFVPEENMDLLLRVCEAQESSNIHQINRLSHGLFFGNIFLAILVHIVLLCVVEDNTDVLPRLDGCEYFFGSMYLVSLFLFLNFLPIFLLFKYWRTEIGAMGLEEMLVSFTVDRGYDVRTNLFKTLAWWYWVNQIIILLSMLFEGPLVCALTNPKSIFRFLPRYGFDKKNISEDILRGKFLTNNKKREISLHFYSAIASVFLLIYTFQNILF